MNEMNALSGVILGKYREDPVGIALPLVTKHEKVKLGGKILEKEKRVYGELCFAGDMHYGDKCFSEPMMHAYLNFLKQHMNVQIGFMGDILENAQLSHYIPEEVLNSDQQIEEFCADWRPFANRVWFALWGNHEEREARETKTTKLMRYLMLEIGARKAVVPPPQRGLHLIVKAGDIEYGCYVHHSKTNARINRKLQLQRAGSQNVASLIAHGHTHELAFLPRTFFHESSINGDIMTLVKRQYMLATGCFLEFPSYAEAGSYPLTEVGAPVVRFYADVPQIDCYDLTTTYRDYLDQGRRRADSSGVSSPFYEHADKTLSRSFYGIEKKVVSSPLSKEGIDVLRGRGNEV